MLFLFCFYVFIYPAWVVTRFVVGASPTNTRDWLINSIEVCLNCLAIVVLNIWVKKLILIFYFYNFFVVNAMAQVGKIKRYSIGDDERELSPEEPLPLYQQRENFYS